MIDKWIEYDGCHFYLDNLTVWYVCMSADLSIGEIKNDKDIIPLIKKWLNE